MANRQLPVGVIQMCWMAPGPVISPSVKTCLGPIFTDGETFQPRPRSRAALAPVPSVALPPSPLAPVKFSGLIDRVLAFDRRDRSPTPVVMPLNGRTAGLAGACWARGVVVATRATKARAVAASSGLGSGRMGAPGSGLESTGDARRTSRACAQGTGVASRLVPAAQISPPAFQYIARSTTSWASG